MSVVHNILNGKTTGEARVSHTTRAYALAA